MKIYGLFENPLRFRWGGVIRGADTRRCSRPCTRDGICNLRKSSSGFGKGMWG